ncbi:HAD family hydrolase [Denitromonas ohlonensis]|jgi:HAD superfamily hydrolase (TIGR01509 family)|uniref:HAD family phosphatase n=2 Tax=Denitromonas TaxID=139331 RepID=A0A558EQ39_9RHOO|nr:HAD family phosphatase [Denitromonas ohlonensis]TVT47236.1 MAG: HAD family phosphatase [Denitromonas halophila]TVO67929.1 HAD family phosphatase [Denitromonas ohlonensis]TVO78166.1 HAD family phosphatase [Denitromonas ohlonensis]TVT68144.1 MAG: HAD family phosphatase [Denitromonas halophila]TVT75452.1 MAG: HAD family phosphatase [Denitromonas halophila]
MNTFNPTDLRAVVFDMDGLLLDSERIAYDIGRQVSLDLGIPWTHEVAMQMIGLNSREHESLLKGAFGDDYPLDAHRAEFGLRYEAVIDAGTIPLKPGVLELFDALEAAGLPRGVATSTRRSRALPKLDAVGLLDRVHIVVAGDEVARGKPAPDIFLAAAERLGQRPSDCLALEDSNAGVRAARDAGMCVVMVPDLVTPADDIRAGGILVVDSLLDIATRFTRQ